VHRLDAARLCRLALEKACAGASYHAVAEEGVPLRDIADVIGRRLKVPVVSKSLAEAADHFCFLGYFVGADGPASSANRNGWDGAQPGLDQLQISTARAPSKPGQKLPIFGKKESLLKGEIVWRRHDFDR
jgi:hypothetical protein